ncbi:MAG: NYN domain-containing protein, partial [Candidatus Bathyanammoxibius sp.]
DCDFERAIELLRSKGKRIIAVSTRGMISTELVNAVDSFIDLNSIRAEVEKKTAPPK